MKEVVINPEIFMDECEFSHSVLPIDELRACQASMSGKYHDFFLRPKDDDS